MPERHSSERTGTDRRPMPESECLVVMTRIGVEIFFSGVRTKKGINITSSES